MPSSALLITTKGHTHAQRSIQERCGINMKFPGRTEYMQVIRRSSTSWPHATSCFEVDLSFHRYMLILIQTQKKKKSFVSVLKSTCIYECFSRQLKLFSNLDLSFIMYISLEISLLLTPMSWEKMKMSAYPWYWNSLIFPVEEFLHTT